MRPDETLDRLHLDEVGLPLQLATEAVEALGRVIDRLRESTAESAPDRLGTGSELFRLAESIYRFRRARDGVFGSGSFADPRWDMLLDLFIARESGRRISVSSACIAAAVPATTALRHLSGLVRDGLVQRREADVDGRVVHVELTEEAQAKVRTVLLSWAGPKHP